MKRLLDSPASNSAGRPSEAKVGLKARLQAVFPEGAGGIAIKEFTSRYAISQETFTRMTGFSLRAVANWSQGSKPSSSTTRRLTEIKRLFAALEQLVSPDAIGPWLKDPNPAFDGSTPLQVIERGETDRIWRMVYELQSGEPA
jgi:DNA-binding transcriptional regulator YiaG